MLYNPLIIIVPKTRKVGGLYRRALHEGDRPHVVNSNLNSKFLVSALVRVSEDQRDRIREATNIVDLVSERVHLKKRGRNFVGLCPFHNEKTPSFTVLEEKGIYKCFGCGKGGDVFSFVMQMENLTFPEALRKLAKRANIEIEGAESEQEGLARSERESLLGALREAYIFYYRTLRGPEGTEAMRYLRSRNLDEDVLQLFGIGYASERFGTLTTHLTGHGFDVSKLEAAGLIARRDVGDHFERFRGRIIFPVVNATGRVVGFGGRIVPLSPNSERRVESAGGAKYINSPDTSVYHKSQILYGLFQAKDAIRREGFAILVEGYADVLAVFQSGTKNVVAASGTSLTVEQLQLLRRYTTSIALLFDADAAGKNATMRGIELAIEGGFDVSVVILPGGEDPDSFIRKNGEGSFRNALEHRQTFIEAKVQIFEEQGAFGDPGRKAQSTRSIVETIAKVPDEIKRAFYIQKLGERFHLSEQLLSTELVKFLAENRNYEERRATHEVERDVREEAAEEQTVDSSIRPSEGELLEAMLGDPIAVADILEKSEFRLVLMQHTPARELISYLVQRVEEDDPPRVEQLLDEYRDKPEVESLIRQFGMTRSAFSEQWDEGAPGDRMSGDVSFAAQARQAIAAIEREEIERRKRELRELIRANPESDEPLLELQLLNTREEMQSKHIQQISGEEA